MRRILHAHDEVRERRRQLRRPVYQKPELLAEAANQVWSWEISKLMGPVKWSYFYLYIIIDIFSRRIVGWHVADAETAALFKPPIDDAVLKHDIAPGQLTLHAQQQSVLKKAALKTLKYQPQFPKRFGCVEDAKIFCRSFIDGCNRDHHHAGIGSMTPDQVHYGQTDAALEARQEILNLAHAPKQAIRRLDQSASPRNPKQGTNQSLNSKPGCLNVVDTFRPHPLGDDFLRDRAGRDLPRGRPCAAGYRRSKSFSISDSFSSTKVGRPWLHWPAPGVASISRNRPFISSGRSARPVRTE